MDRFFANVPIGKKFLFSKKENPTILQGFKETILGEPRWGLPPQLRRGNLHAIDYGDACEIHMDRWNPETHPWEHLRDDAPHLLALMLVGGIGVVKLTWQWLKGISQNKEGISPQA